MKSKFAWLPLAALAAVACMSCDAGAATLVSTFTMSWDPVTQNDDGSPITDLLGYYVYCGSTPDMLYPQYFTAQPSIPLLLFPGCRYFAVDSVTISGVESALTEVVSPPDL